MDLFSLLPPNTVIRHKGHFTKADMKVLKTRGCIAYLELNHEDSQITQIIVQSPKFQPNKQVTMNVNGERTTKPQTP